MIYAIKLCTASVEKNHNFERKRNWQSVEGPSKWRSFACLGLINRH